MNSSSGDFGETVKNGKKPRFQLCFSAKNSISTKSDVWKTTFKLCGISLPILTPKFHTQQNIELTEEDEKEVEELIKKLELINKLGPRDKYKEPILESHRYGWFHESFAGKNPDLDRVKFPKNTSDMVKLQNLFAQFTSQVGDRCE